MKNVFLVFAGLLFSVSSFSQNTPWCLTDVMLQKQIDAHPEYKELLHQSRILAAQPIVNSNLTSAKTGQIVVPVVVHVIHDNGVGNISLAQILSGLEVLNLDYNRMNADTVDTRDTANAPFNSIAAGIDIAFKLAKIDPSGNCTNGIVRVNAPHLTYNAGEDCKYTALGGSDAWPVDQYFNIWVVNNINSDGGAGIIAGYAYYPNNGPMDYYGILMDDDYFGTIETAEFEDGDVLTHEMGHALGLPHIFDGGCQTGDCYTEGDYSCDTPPQQEANWGCSPSWNSCSNIPINDGFGFDAMDQVENYMSYNSCQNMFSADQVNIMQYSLSNIPFLANLTSVANVLATGANNPDVLCAAEFDCYKRILCIGSETDFHDFSHSSPNAWIWSVSPGVGGADYVFVNGTSASSQNPRIQFNTSGFYQISLTATDGVTSDADVKIDYIHVLPQNGGLPFYEGFEAYTDLNSTVYWAIMNQEGNAEFEIVNGVSHSGNKSVKLSNFGQSGTNSDVLFSSQVDLSGLLSTDVITLSFRYAYRKRFASNDEWLKVFITKDCADTWVQRRTIHGDALSTLTSSNSWAPGSENDWTTIHMTNVTSSYYVDNFRYKFEFESDGGNNIYLDDINIYDGAPSDDLIIGIDEVEVTVGGFSIYPNPTEDELNIEFSLSGIEKAQITIADISGKVAQKSIVLANEGNNLVFVNTSELNSGVYFVKVNVGGVENIAQFIVK